MFDNYKLSIHHSFVDPCDSGPCQNGGECVPGEGLEYTCRCPEEFEGDRCEKRKSKCAYDITYRCLIIIN